MATLASPSTAPAPSPAAPSSRSLGALTEDQKNWYACLFFLGSVGLSFVMGLVALAVV